MTRKLYAGLAIITILALASLSIGLMSKEAAAINTGKTGLLFPLYVSPGASWDTVITLKHNHPNLPIIIIANVNGGAGSSSSSSFVTGIQKMQAAGIKVLGYVPTGYASRPLADREAEIDKWNTWYHVDGIGFDEMSNKAGNEQYYQTLKDYVHSHGMTIARGNPGTRTIESYYTTMDIINVYEGTSVPSASTLVSGNGAWTVKYDKNHFGATIKSDPTFDPASFTPVYPYVGWIYVTNTNWGAVPSYLEQEAVALDALNGAPPVVPPPVPQPLVPQPPTGLTANAISNSQINLSWTAPNNGGSAITGYKIERSTDGGVSWNVIIPNTASTTTSNSNTGLASSTTYTYRVSAINVIGTGSPSSSASATTLSNSVPPPVVQPPIPQPPIAGSSSVLVSVKSVDLAQNPITGMWAVIRYPNGTTITQGFTPVSFSIASGHTYVVHVGNFNKRIFNHWNDGTTSSYETITPVQDTVLTAYYAVPTVQSAAGSPITVSVKSVDLSGNSISGMSTVIRSTTGVTLKSGYTPFLFQGTSGEQYVVHVRNYKDRIFNHWNDGTTSSYETITPTNNVELTAFYSTSITPPVLPKASLSPNPSSGLSGTLVKISGTNFAPLSTISIKFDGSTQITTPVIISTDPFGSFTSSITIPASTVGLHSVSATDASANVVSVPFTVTSVPVPPIPLPSIQLSPSSGLVGSTIHVSGSHFAPSSTISIKFDGTILTTSPVTITTDSSGSFASTTFLVPSSTIASHTVSATDASTKMASSQFSTTSSSSISDTTLVTGLSQPTSMEISPDGRIFIDQKAGSVIIVKNGVKLATPFLTIPVNSANERGLLGIAFDPNFASNGFVYIYHTETSPIHNVVSRFTASTTNPDVADMNSRVDIISFENVVNSNHNGGAIHFGPDGKLYIAVGNDAINSNSQSLSNHKGKIIRINPDGTAPSDNPFFAQGGAAKDIWAYGLRNPFTFAFSPTGTMYINDVGENTWEEINQGTKGANYGWSICEGTCNTAGMTNPIFEYNHSVGQAITGGAFYQGNLLPAQYQGSYFFSDYLGGWIHRLDSNKQESSFLTANSPVDIKVSPDGTLYYISIGSGTLHKVT